MEKFSFLKKVGKGAGILLIGILVSKVLMYVFRAVIAKHFGASVYGLLSLALAIVSFIASVAMLGLQEGLLRYIAFYLGKSNEKIIAPMIGAVVKRVFPSSLFLGVIVFIFAKQISITFFSKPELIPFLQIAAFLIPLLVLYAIFDKVLQAFQDAKALAIAKTLADPLGKIILIIPVIVFGMGALGTMFAYIFGMVVSLTAMIFYLKGRIVNFNYIFLRPGKLSKEILYYSLPLLFAGFIITLLSWIDIIILGIFVDSASIGVYDIAVVTSRLVTVVPLAFSTMFMPAITELFASDKGEVSKLYQHVSKWVLLLLLPMMFFLAMFSKTLLGSLFGLEFIAGAVSLNLLLLAQIFWGVNLLSSNVLEMLKRTKLILFNCVFSAVLNIILNFILIPKMGILGAAIATAISTFVVNVMYMVEAAYLIKANPFDFSVVKMAVSIAVPVIALVVFFRSWFIDVSLVYALVLGFLMTAVYGGLLFVTKCFDSEDIALFKLALKKYLPSKPD